MEQQDPGGGVGPDSVSSPTGSSKSKLDTLSKEDLIKFTKKQMAAMQKMKSKCSDLEKEVEALKLQPKFGSDDTIIQELTERMDSLLLEKAETQQTLVKTRKDKEKTAQQAEAAEENVAKLLEELAQTREEHQRQIVALEEAMEESKATHQEEVGHFKRLLSEREESDREKESERERGRRHTESPEDVEAVRLSLERQLKSLQSELEVARGQRTQEAAMLQEEHQRALTEAQQEVENLREELLQRSQQHEEEMKALEEDCEMERERLLILQEELTEQLALKDSYLQDVQEEEEEPGRGSGIARMLELSSRSHGDSSIDGSGMEAEAGRLRAALEDLQAQNTMLQDELTLLGNVKEELEAELERVREEFLTEREELEFKIDELQMNRESATPDHMTHNPMTPYPMTPDQHKQEGPALFELRESGPLKDQKDGPPSSPQEPATSSSSPAPGSPETTPEDDHQSPGRELQELRARCEDLSRERDSAVAEYQYTRDVLQGLESELGQRTGDFVRQYEAMKEQGAEAVKELQERVQLLGKERAGLEQRVQALEEERDSLLEEVREVSEGRGELLERLGERSEERDLLGEKVRGLAEQRDSLEEKVQVVSEERSALSKKVRELGEEKDGLSQKVQVLSGEKSTLTEKVRGLQRKLEGSLVETEAADGVKEKLQSSAEEQAALAGELRASVETLELQNEEILSQLHLKESALQELEEILSTLTLEKERSQSLLHLREEELEKLREEKEREMETISDLTKGNAELQRSLEEGATALIQAQNEKTSLGKQLGELEDRMEKDSSERQQLESKLEALMDEIDQTRSSVSGVQEQSQAPLDPDLQSQLDSLSRERNLLRTSLDEERAERGRSEEELAARLEEVEKEGTMLRSHLEEVVADTEALQRDLAQMTLANQKIREENQSAAQSAPLEETASRQFSEKIALLEKENQEKDVRMNKIKAVAVKARKELESSKKEVVTLKEEVELLKTERERVSSSMKDIIHGAEGYKNLQLDYDRRVEHLDKEREKVEGAEKQIMELTKRLIAAVTQHEQLSSEKEDLLAGMETVRGALRQLEAQHHDLSRHASTLDRDLTTERLLKEKKAKELSSAVKEVEELTAQLRKHKHQSQQTAQELEQLRKEAQQSSLMDMEMADYERLVKELNAKLSERDVCVEELKTQLHTHTQREDSLNQEIEGLKSQVDQGEEKTSKMKQLLVKTKKDLADSKKQEASHMMLQATLKGELEAYQQQLESSKIQVCEVTAERHRVQEQLRTVTEQHQRTTSALQHTLSTLQEECDVAKAELASTAGEFESYKVRVHNVLKQQKSKSSSQSEGEPGRQEREQMSGVVDQLKARLEDTQQGLQSTLAELQQLQAQHGTLLERHNKMLQETVTKEAELRERLLSLQSEGMALRAAHAQTLSDALSQAEAQRAAFREQVRHLQDEHRTTVETQQSQISRLEAQLFTLQSQTSLPPVQTSRKALMEPRRLQDQGGVGGLSLALNELQSMAREEGEGMETAEPEPPSPAHTPLPSLEQLLTSPDPKQEPFVWQVEPTKEELNQKLNTATRSMEHMNSLLHETEATNAVLMEQVTLLKSEVRRLERNHEREKSVANLEYLKNVLLQFIFLPSGSEKQALLPVIHTMLQLSPEEKNKLAAIALGEEEGAGSRGSGWSSYLHSWSGIK
ncbi:uncharacterized protein gcc2 [Aplochiton taeniatus]